MKNYNTIIIGCGASGVMCALSSKCDQIAVIDACTKPAKKIMVTGNGRCNLTNINLNSSFYNQNIDKYLSKFSVNNTLKFFSDLGLEYYNDEEGRVYPISNSAKSVVDVLVNNLENKVDIFCEQKVIEINLKDDKFEILTDKESFSCKKLVIASGGNTLINEIEKLGIKTSKFIPSLVALKCNNVKKDLNGIKVSNVKVTVSNGKETKSEKGEVLFKESGLSGIVIFNLSSLFARNKEFKGKIEIDLFPDLPVNKLVDKLKERKNLNVVMSKYFVGMFQNSLASEILNRAKINTNLISSKLNDTQIQELANIIKNLSFNVVDCYDNNQVYSGGVELTELGENLMSKNINNLYFCGEVCNVDGVCGGYNLQWAWTSGRIVGENI